MVIAAGLLIAGDAGLPNADPFNPEERCRSQLAWAGEPSSTTGQRRRRILPSDLIELRDIGSTFDLAGEDLLAISPNGRFLSFQLSRADLARNGYCTGIVVLDLHDRSARLVDASAEAMRVTFPNLLDKGDFPAGFIRPTVPQWLPGSQSIIYLKSVAGRVELWRAEADGGRATQIFSGKLDVANFRVADDGKSLIYGLRSGAADAQRSLEAEGINGFHFDTRYSPLTQAMPFAQGPLPLSNYQLDLRTGTSTPAALVGPPAIGLVSAISDRIGPPWRRSGDAPEIRTDAANRLVAQNDAGATLTCMALGCIDPELPAWWSRDRRSIVFLKREGWGRETTSFYRWMPSSGRVVRLLSSTGAFIACQPSADDAICTYEASTTPRRIVRVKLSTGQLSTLFDPNPEFARLELGRIERLHWLVAGAQVYGDLVYPVGFSPRQRYPLVVVQYSTREFLRGGTGDAYPIQSFADRGYFVLSFENPTYPALPHDGSIRQAAAELKDYYARRNNLQAIEEAVRRLIKRGWVDPHRVGITGLSEGSSTVQFAGLNSTMFGAAAMSHCCWEPTQDALLGPTISDYYHDIGQPRFGQFSSEFWRPMSWMLNPHRVDFPVLMQLTDHEYLSAVESFTALQQAGRPAAMYVFPEEYHTLWGPSHRLATYRRSLAWFDFWLRPDLPTPTSDQVFTKDWSTLLNGICPGPSRRCELKRAANDQSKPRYRAAP